MATTGEIPFGDEQYAVPVCDLCDKLAVVNYQKYWHRYTIDDSGGYYSDDEWPADHDPSGDDNIHLCSEHEESEGW